MSRFVLYTAVLLAIGVSVQAGELPKIDREAGPLPFQRIRQTDDRAIETEYATTRMVREQRVDEVTTPDGRTRHVVRTVEKPVTEVRTRGCGVNSVEAFTADGAIVEGKELRSRLAKAEAVAVFWLSQEPDADYLKLMKPGTLIVCLPDSPFPSRRPAPAPDPSGNGSFQPESPRPTGAPPPVQEKPVAEPHPPRAEAGYVSIDGQGRLQLRRPGSQAPAARHKSPEPMPLGAVRAYDLKKNLLDKEKVQALLKNEKLVLIAHGKDPVDPYYSQFLKPDTLILVIGKTR